jgi:hypothetical protein
VPCSARFPGRIAHSAECVAVPKHRVTTVSFLNVFVRFLRPRGGVRLPVQSVPTRASRPKALAVTGAAAYLPPILRAARHTGKLQLVGLAGLQAHFGDRWDAMRERAMAIAAKAIRRRLVDSDVFARANENSFVVLFVGLDDEQAGFKARAIAAEVQSLLCGELAGGHGLTVTSQIVGLKGTTDSPDFQSPDAFGAWVDRAINASAPVMADSALAPTSPPDLEPETDHDPVASLRVDFVPVWNVWRTAVAGHSCQLTRVQSAGGVSKRVDAYLGNGCGSLGRDMDRVALRAAGDAVRMIEQGAPVSGIIVPLHFDTVATSINRHTLMGAIRGLPDGTQDYLGVELCGTPPGTPESRILEVLSVFKAFCHHVIMRLPFDPRAIRSVPLGSVDAISTIVGSEVSGQALVDRMTKFIEQTKRHGLNATLVQERRPDVAALAMRAGFTHIGGEVIGPPVSRPSGMYRHTPDFMKARDCGPPGSHEVVARK